MSLVSKLTYSYDNAGQLLSEVQNLFTIAAKTNRYTYDSDGLRLTHTYPAGNVITNTYTARNQIASIIADGPPPLATFAYDANGNRTAKTLENNTGIAYAYDNASHMLTVDHQLSGVSFASFAYGYNSVGNRTSRVESSAGFQPATDSYTYDPTDQATAVSYNSGARTAGYQWDAVGNRVSVTTNGVATSYTANNLNQYTTVGGGTPTYDSKGNLVTQNGWTYTFDAQNRLLTANNATTTSSFSYDTRNRCVSRTINGVTSLLIYDRWNLIEEWTTGGTQVAHYVHGPSIDELLVKVSTTNAVYYHHDALGSVTHLTSTNGAVVERYTYDIFGAVTIKDGNGNTLGGTAYANRFLFTGREWLADVALYDYRNRIYAPDLGRFLQTDPIRFSAGDVDLYRYVKNNPINHVDLFGLKDEDKDKKPCCNADNKVPDGAKKLLAEAAKKLAGVGKKLPGGAGANAAIFQMILLASKMDKSCADMDITANKCYTFGTNPDFTGCYDCCRAIQDSVPGNAFAHVSCQAICAQFL